MGTLDEDDAIARERVGTVLDDKWSLEGLLGVGGMAAVYAGRHRNGARAAIKVLHPMLARNAEVRERFRREAYAANKVEHRGVVKVLDDDVVASGPDSGLAYLVMERLEGESLQDRLERGELLGERALLELARAVLEVLEVAHASGVVHRDLKPENLYFARDDKGETTVKVLDFGLARLAEAQAITSYGLALGTPSFMSPEQASGRTDAIDGRTDLFSLAATCFRLRTGKRLHEADDAVELVKKMGRMPAPAIRSVASDVSKPFARVIDKALQFERDDRYESAAAMRADVERALAELEAEERPAPPSSRQRPPALSQRPPMPSQRPPAPSKGPPAEPPAPSAPREATIELSGSDLEPQPAYGIDESIRIPKRRSILPWLLLLVLGGLGVLAWRNPDRVRDTWTSVAAWWAARSNATDVDAGTAPSASSAASSAPEAGVAPRPHNPASHRPPPPKPPVPAPSTGR